MNRRETPVENRATKVTQNGLKKKERKRSTHGDGKGGIYTCTLLRLLKLSAAMNDGSVDRGELG